MWQDGLMLLTIARTSILWGLSCNKLHTVVQTIVTLLYSPNAFAFAKAEARTKLTTYRKAGIDGVLPSIPALFMQEYVNCSRSFLAPKRFLIIVGIFSCILKGASLQYP